MYYYDTPVEFQKMLTEMGLIDDIYKSMQQDDKADVIMTAMEILKKTNKMPMIMRVPEVEEASRFFRQLGDQTLEEEDYRNAFDLYNQALRCAPKNSSNSMLEAYFGRARLFYKINSSSACLADIDKCLEWKHPFYQQKLKQMKADCLKKIKSKQTPPQHPFVKNFFNIRNKHPKVPSVSAEVDFIIENGQSKVVAARNIEIGTVIALETAYIGHLDEENQIRACHFCHAFSLNLIPCDNCRLILFCSEKCKKLCWEEYHNVECHIIHVLDVINVHNLIYPLTVKAAIKLKNLCSWEEFKSLSLDLGLKQMNSNLINEVYDVTNKASILRCNNNKHFVFGETYNAAFIYAMVIHYLENVPSFFPRDVKGKDEAIRAMSRVLLHLRGAFGHITRIENAAINSRTDDITTIQQRNFGLFSFTSKLKHSCDPNLYVTGLNNKVAIIALKPIKSGAELTMSYIGHWHDTAYADRALKMFIWSEIPCRCRVCVEGWNVFNLQNAKMTVQQKRLYEKWNSLRCRFSLGLVDITVLYVESCVCLHAFHNLSNTKEHKEIFGELRSLILAMQYETTKNCTILEPFKKSILKLGDKD